MRKYGCLLKIGIVLSILIAIFLVLQKELPGNSFVVLAADEQNQDYCYLSDISYIKEKSSVASEHSIKLDQNDSNDLIRLKIDGKSTPFIKGICAWATSTIVYDLGEHNYDYFTSYLGVDISEHDSYYNTGVRFYIYTSDDGENWQEKYNSNTIDGRNEAIFVKVDIQNAKYLKLVADKNSDNWWAEWYDEAVYANAKLIKEGHKENLTPIADIKTVEEYDNYIKEYRENYKEEHEGKEAPITGDYELNILQREFVNNVGYDVLQSFVKCSDEYKNAVLWLMNNPENLRLYLTGGKPEGSYIDSLKVLEELYTKYKDTDLIDETISVHSGKTLKELYRNMILSISLTHSGNVYLWITGANQSDPIMRYEIYKDLYKENLIESKKFESLTVEEMRWVMNTVIDDEEIKWLNNYTRTIKNGATGPYSYIKYKSGYNYLQEKYYSEENYNEWNEKYKLSDYNVPYEANNPKLWVVFEEGSVCGGLSKTGSCIWGAFKGLPNTCVSQPGHCAYIFYDQDEDGNGIWRLGNDVFGWGQSGKTEHLNVRMMNDWGNGNYSGGWNACYMLLAQAAQNEYERYEKSEEVLMLAKVYSSDSEEIEKIYREALEEEEINFDAWLSLVNVYLNDENRTEEEYYNLAEEIAENLTYYPRPMYDLLALIEPKLESSAYSEIFTMLRNKTLTTATQATSEETLQVTAVKQVANALLGTFDSNIATFSFDGENAGKIVLSDKYGDANVEWDFSLDGGNTWTQTGEHIYKLSETELSSITSKNDIKIHIIGVNYNQENIFTIDIKESSELLETLYADDLENKLIGANNSIQWKFKEEDEWTSYSEAEPDLTGDKVVIVRVGATGVYLASKNSKTYTFTENKTEIIENNPEEDNIPKEDVPEENEPEEENVPKEDVPEEDNLGTDIKEELFFNTKYKTIKEDENEYLYRINQKTTLRDFIVDCETNGTITIYKKDGTVLGENEYVGTGMTLEITKGTQIIELKIAIKGDLSGDGKVTITDLSTINKAILRLQTLENEYKIAGDLDENNNITITDLSTINKIILKLI